MEAFPDLPKRFEEFADACSRFSREVMREIPEFATMDSTQNATLNLKVIRTVFGKWGLDILSILYTSRGAGFQDIRNALGPLSSRVLSTKLGRMEELGLIQRAVSNSKPPRVRYTLTDKGLRISKLGEPVVLYLRMTETLLVPMLTATVVHSRGQRSTTGTAPRGRIPK